VGPTVGPDGVKRKNPFPAGNLTPGHPGRSLVPILTELSRSVPIYIKQEVR